MLRTNESFLSYAENLYNAQLLKEDIVFKKYEKGQNLFNQNDTANKVMLIKTGITKCFFTENNDKEYILEFLSSGEIIGEIELLRKIPCLCSVQALTDVSVYAFSVPYFEKLLKQDLNLNALLLHVFAERIINTSSRASYQQLYTTDHSLSKLMALQKKYHVTISKEDMAAYLGISVRSLNRTIKSSKKENGL